MCRDAFDWVNYGTEVNFDLSTQPAPNDNCGWTTFFNQGGGSNLVFNYAKYYAGEGGTPSPDVMAGHKIKLYNGNMSGNMWHWLADKAAQPGGFSVIVPVIEEADFVQEEKILGFANYVITAVDAVGRGGHTLHGYFRYIENVNAKEAKGQLGLFGIRLSNAALIP
ncbi:MAG: hypothetical protein DRG58_02730 [Deltaproteobacteria bacterium]|nr:MAG: hypothetical protein DRG58_02730 [Deltaproteobacteria bacterium]